MFGEEGNPCEVDSLYSLPGRSRLPLSYTLIKAEWHQNEKSRLSFCLKEETEDKNIIILLYVSEEKASDVKRLAVQKFLVQPLATYSDNEYSKFSCSSVIFNSKVLFAFMSSYLPYDLHLFTQFYWIHVFYVILSKWPSWKGPSLAPMQGRNFPYCFLVLRTKCKINDRGI